MVKARGDLTVDDHHTVEDVGIALEAHLRKHSVKVRDREVRRCQHSYDEALATAVLDISGRSYLAFDAKLGNQNIGGFSPQNTRHFFESLVSNAGINATLLLLERTTTTR